MPVDNIDLYNRAFTFHVPLEVRYYTEEPLLCNIQEIYCYLYSDDCRVAGERPVPSGCLVIVQRMMTSMAILYTELLICVMWYLLQCDDETVEFKEEAVKVNISDTTDQGDIERMRQKTLTKI